MNGALSGGARRRWRTTALLSVLLFLLAVTAAGDARVGGAVTVRGGDGMDVLRRAARVGEDLSYQGTWSVSWWDEDESGTALVDVVHRPGVGTLVGPAAGQAPGAKGYLMGADTWTGPDDVLLDLMEGNFWVRAEESEEVSDRTAVLVEARRDSGLTAARFWVDEETGLLLRSETYDLDGALTRSNVFLSVRFGVDDEPVAPSGTAPGGMPWGNELDEADLAGLRSDGWPLPERLHQGFALVEARSTGSGEGRVAHLTYSDGICLVSVFVQHGSLGEGALSGLRAVEEDGAVVHVGEGGQHQRVWEADGFVYTVLADAPKGVVAASLTGLPAPDGTGFWARVGRGFGRLGTWIGGGAS
ncbi:sigma-E factor regulatory protein RseB domain-containing protein [Actinorugispora endophytica]|uniref:MucB/RseB-like sigma(E) regulatory protein n=1 Tax=Actinorugispora endophytica TaxID=1605990 RepID=A0A4R6V6N7_9ACTN|nr:sigma-E factor regulatory protein RseB domain-containing protein [Actinorugispora endophytica]TDQ54746.1 MucB/RseB-like sigma(E) regulatory protein [Actinorugispora endophytica]